MPVSCISQPCSAVNTSDEAERYRNAAIGILFVPLVELLVTPIQLALDSRGVNFPGSIIVMALCTVVMLSIEFLHRSTGPFYEVHMKGPVDFLGRHMSLGFITPLVMLSKDHITTVGDAPRICEAFVLTTLLSYLASFTIAAGLYKIEDGLRGSRRRCWDAEKVTQPTRHPPQYSERTSTPRQPTAVFISGNCSNSVSTLCLSSTTIRFAVKTAPLWAALLLLLTVGVPVYRFTNYDMPFETFCFVFLWIGSLQSQRSLNTCTLFESRARMRSILAIMLNPVLVTAGLGTAYFWTEAAVTHRDIDDVLTSFHHHDSWAEIVRQSAADHNPRQHIGAGDLSTALLDAGIVSLGFKMFEHRRALWAARTTVVTTSLALATANVLAGVAVAARAAALPPAEALAFAARSTTVALGVPAVRSVGGSTTLMSALVVFGGMLWQMAGDAVLGWMGVRDRPPPIGPLRPRQQDRNGTQVQVRILAGGGGGEEEAEVELDNTKDGYKVVAAGVAVGINAAAMGTAHLIERHSRAAAYSALSMTIFGVFTVALTSVPPIADALIMLASR